MTVIHLMIGNTFEPQLMKFYSPRKRNSLLLVLVGLYLKKNVLKYNSYFINEKKLEICFLFYYISISIIS